MAEFSGKVDSWSRCPDAESAWNFPEWSNVGGFGIAGETNASDESHAIYVVDLSSSNYEKIAEGQVLEYPFLWIQADNIPEFGDLES